MTSAATTNSVASPAPVRAGASPICVEPLASAAEWEAFVDAAPTATFFHRLGWRDVLERSFGFRAHYLTARRSGRLVGILPLCEWRPPFGRRRLQSLPFAVEAGVCAADDDAQQALEDAASELAARLGARTLELRDGLVGSAFQLHGGIYCGFRRTLLARDEDEFARIPRKRRRMIRVGQRGGLSAQDGTDLDTFYVLYARTQRRLGTPLLPLAYFAELQRRFARQVILLAVHRGETPVAAVLSFVFRDRILPYYAGSREEFFHYGSNDFMYWELMRLARRRGLTVFDFGRSRVGSGAFQYKRHWGFTPEPLQYRVRTFGADPTPRRTVDDPRLRILRRVWSRLPFFVTMRVGPPLACRFAPLFT